MAQAVPIRVAVLLVSVVPVVQLPLLVVSAEPRLMSAQTMPALAVVALSLAVLAGRRLPEPATVVLVVPSHSCAVPVVPQLVGRLA